MAAIELNGKELAQQLRNEMKDDVAALQNKGITPQLTVILVGDNPASMSYVNGKKKASAEVGIDSNIINLSADITEETLLEEIDKLNEDPTVHGILVQLPLPDHIQEQHIIEAISPQKDVDGFHPINIGKMMTNQNKAYAEVGIDSNIINLSADITEETLLEEIDKLNEDPTVHGILVQLPLPDHIQEQHIIEAISPQKDVDGFHPINIGKMMTNQN